MILHMEISSTQFRLPADCVLFDRPPRVLRSFGPQVQPECIITQTMLIWLLRQRPGLLPGVSPLIAIPQANLDLQSNGRHVMTGRLLFHFDLETPKVLPDIPHSPHKLRVRYPRFLTQFQPASKGAGIVELAQLLLPEIYLVRLPNNVQRCALRSSIKVDFLLGMPFSNDRWWLRLNRWLACRDCLLFPLLSFLIRNLVGSSW